MTWISFVCLLALSSAAFGYSISGYPQVNVPELPVRPTFPVGSQYQSLDRPPEPRRLAFDLPQPATLPLSEADILCNGKPADFVIPLNGGEKFIVCTTDSKGDEFFCPKGLLYNDETKRCERKYNPNQNPCASQPCLNGGRCIPTQYSYQCDCSQGFTGRTCELDASVCHQQQPCGQSFDSFCQSFHVGSALKHVCILQEGRAYGLTGSQSFPNPCLSTEGIHPLAFGNEGFIMCDGEQMFVESCPGGTIWDSLTKVCVWPDMERAPSPVGFGNTQATTIGSVLPMRAVVPMSSPSLGFSLPKLSVQVVRNSGGGGGGGGGASRSGEDSTERFGATEFRSLEAKAEEPIRPSVSSFGSSGDDFAPRFSGGEFRAAQAPGRLSGGRSTDFTGRFAGGDFRRTIESGGEARDTPRFPFAGVPGASRKEGNRDDLDRPLARGLVNDDSTSSSIPIPFKRGGSGEMERRGMMTGRDGIPPNNSFSRPGEARRSSMGNRF